MWLAHLGSLVCIYALLWTQKSTLGYTIFKIPEKTWCIFLTKVINSSHLIDTKEKSKLGFQLRKL